MAQKKLQYEFNPYTFARISAMKSLLLKKEAKGGVQSSRHIHSLRSKHLYYRVYTSFIYGNLQKLIR